MQNGKEPYSDALASSSPTSVEMRAPQNNTWSNGESSLTYVRDREDENSAQRWQRLLSLLRRRRKLAGGIFLGVIALAAIYMRFAPRIYRAQADVLINTDKNPMSNIADSLPALGSLVGSTGARSQETEVVILNSNMVRETALKMLPASDRKTADEDMVVSIRPIRQTDIISVYVSGRDENKANAYANAICAAYLRQNQESNSEQYKGSADYVQSQLNRVQGTLDKQRQALRDYKIKYDIADLPTESQARVELIGTMTTQLKTTSAEVAAGEARLRDLKAQIAGVPTTQVAERTITERPAVAALKAQLTELEGKLITALQEYTPNSPEVQDLQGQITALKDRLRQESAREVTGEREAPNPLRLQLAQGISETQAEVWAKQASVSAMQQNLNVEKQSLKQLPDREYRLSQLQADLAITTALFGSLQEKFQTLSISKEAPMTNARIISRADEAELVSPLLKSTLVLALLLGTLCAIGGAALVDRFDDRVYNEEDARQISGLPILAQIPLTREKGNPLLLGPSPSPVLLESFRMLRTQLVLGMPNAKHTSLAFTSSQPHEGKSTVAVNLAIAMALNGKKVILLDADLRRPQVHVLFDVANTAGFTSVVAGLATMEETLVQVLDNLEIMPAGPMPPNPPELLDSMESRDLVRALQERADVLIIDTPPAPFMADAQIVATMVNGVVFVLSTKDARRHGVERAIELLEATGTRMPGIVLNKQDAESSVYYSDYRYKAYLTGGDAPS
ncbi:polysaccharide biosynthesis tyrosine autokinase [bacterium]|nr:MAG: polysaccharide biosynthesis tyrosine autokinase [bacterium]